MEFLPKCDIEVLELVKKAQHDKDSFFMAYDDDTIRHIDSLGDKPDDTLNLTIPEKNRKDFDDSILYLIKRGYVESVDKNVLHVTHEGWYFGQLTKRERRYMRMTNFWFPALVAFFTTVLTLSLQHLFTYLLP